MENVTGPLSVADLARFLDQQHAPRTWAEIAAEGRHFQVPATRSGVGGPTSDPQHRALAVAAEQGRVLRGGKPDQAPVRVLTALARRGYLTLTAHPGARRGNWAYGVLTPAGRRELARLDAEQAEREAAEGARDRALAVTAGRVSPTGAADPFALCRDATTDVFDRIDAAFATT